eukprot:209326-Chlamydomonas_euryale.AAC.5
MTCCSCSLRHSVTRAPSHRPRTAWSPCPRLVELARERRAQPCGRRAQVAAQLSHSGAHRGIQRPVARLELRIPARRPTGVAAAAR